MTWIDNNGEVRPQSWEEYCALKDQQVKVVKGLLCSAMKLRQLDSPSRNRRSLSKDKRLALWKRAHGRCWYCGEGTPKTWFVLEHVVPRSRGGANGPSNLVVACRPCDRAKSSVNLEEFRVHRGVELFYGETITDPGERTKGLRASAKNAAKRAAKERKRQYWREMRNQRLASLSDNRTQAIQVLDLLIESAPDWPTTKAYMQQRYALVSQS